MCLKKLFQSPFQTGFSMIHRISGWKYRKNCGWPFTEL